MKQSGIFCNLITSSILCTRVFGNEPITTCKINASKSKQVLHVIFVHRKASNKLYINSEALIATSRPGRGSNYRLQARHKTVNHSPKFRMTLI